MCPPGADQGRCYSHPHHRRCERGMRVGGVRVEAQQVTVVASGVPAANVQARSSLGPGNHSGGTVLTAPRVQLLAIAVNRGSTAVRTSGVFSSVRAISGESRRRRSSRQAPRLATTDPPPPTARRLLRTATDQNHLTRRSEHPRQVGDRRRHRLSREERQLTHENDSRPAAHLRGVTGPHWPESRRTE